MKVTADNHTDSYFGSSEVPNDFVVFSSERITVFRFIRLGPDNWEQHIRRLSGWDFHDNVGESTAKEAFDCGHNQVFFRHK